MAVILSYAVMLLPLVAQLATEVHGRQHYRNMFEVLLKTKGLEQDAVFKDCCQIRTVANVLNSQVNTETGVYDITGVCPNTLYTLPRTTINRPPSVVQARCDMTTDSGGWLVILRRRNNTAPLVEFNRMWTEYKNGFGNLNTEFWYGLTNIHCLTQRDDVELRIELQNNDGSGRVTWTYQEFRVDGPETNYVLHIGGAERIEGTGGDAMAYHNGSPFSTIDKDNDASSGNCAAFESQGNGGGWWYTSCFHSALTRPHTGNNTIYWPSPPYYFPQVEMKIRRKNC